MTSIGNLGTEAFEEWCEGTKCHLGYVEGRSAQSTLLKCTGFTKYK